MANGRHHVRKGALRRAPLSSRVARCAAKGILIITRGKVCCEGHTYHHAGQGVPRRASLSSRVARCAAKGILIITRGKVRCEGHPYHHAWKGVPRRASLSSRVERCAAKGILFTTCRQMRCEGHPYVARLPYVCIKLRRRTKATAQQNKLQQTQAHRNVPLCLNKTVVCRTADLDTATL